MKKLTVEEIRAKKIDTDKDLVCGILGDWISPSGPVEIYAVINGICFEVYMRMANGKAEMLVDPKIVAHHISTGTMHK